MRRLYVYVANGFTLTWFISKIYSYLAFYIYIFSFLHFSLTFLKLGEFNHYKEAKQEPVSLNLLTLKRLKITGQESE